MLKQRISLAVAALGLGLMLSGCATIATETIEDRAQAEEATEVKIFNNSDTDVPSVAYFCLGEYGWASTLPLMQRAASKDTAALTRFPEYDPICADRKDTE